jgi:hypothetical protein
MVLPLGLEPRTLCLEDRCSIQLSYESKWCPEWALNPQPHAYKACALNLLSYRSEKHKSPPQN